MLERQTNQKGCKMMKKNEKDVYYLEVYSLAMFVLWTAIQNVQSDSQNETI